MTVLNVIRCVQLLNRHKTKDKVRQKCYMCTNMTVSTHTGKHASTLRVNGYSRFYYADQNEMKKVL